MKHMVLIIAMVITCVLVAVANVVVSRIIGINIFTFKLWFIVPVGAGAVGFLAASGAILAARYFNIVPTVADVTFMVIVAAGTMMLVYYLDYATLVLDDGRKASDLVDFRTFVDVVLTKSHMRVGRAMVDAGEVGQMGYLLALVEFFGFLIGGVATFGFILSLPVCADCGSFVRKLKTKKTGGLIFDEAVKMIELFRQGDTAMVKDILAWSPPPRPLDRDNAVIITFDLYGCPKCKTETIIATVKALHEKEWVSMETQRRSLASGLTLRHEFS